MHMILKLGDSLIPALESAEEVYVATALLTLPILSKIENALTSDCKRQYLVGVDLATPINVIKRLKDCSDQALFKARIYKDSSTFHPKVYIIKRASGLIAFIGSANATESGFYHNTEVSILIDDQNECTKLLNWFSELYNSSSDIEDGFIESYEMVYGRIRSRDAANRSDINSLSLTQNKPLSTSITLNDQFFKDRHYHAYTEPFHYDYGEKANAQRKVVKERMKELHKIIYPRFQEFDLKELNAHWWKPNITSSEVYRKGFNQKQQDAMWLHYGYSKERANGRSFMELPRIQVILVRAVIGVWFAIGKDYGSKQLRENLKNELKSSLSYRKYFHQLLEDLGASYRLFVGGVDHKISDLQSFEDTYDLMMTDNQKKYLILARDFDKNDPFLSEDQIGETILDEFKRLYPIYEEILRFS
ncbi:MAG: hypothetical protein COW03_13360 [Cytophagales bacterium CG12_big_fil_rev_8_21_14_0_65_40_12]|nr:MAG: hypothetical protein COW03_13360 [Cytophagales bacterium CG12_big_fil_rev_8_21_14_0_65_40_12]PIW03123.1 MAG: hypothetical protein COW40_17435 [Cytophagales bacterium CG17_big_fil_post_rev_8_21_14_2_50_40_13]